MYQNKAILMGFLGNDAEVRTGKNDQKFTTFSLATKTSYKNKESGEYISHTEWHRCIVFGKFGEFAATLKKGEHIQLEGEIRHTEYTPKRRRSRSAPTAFGSLPSSNSIGPRRPPRKTWRTSRNRPTTSPSRGCRRCDGGPATTGLPSLFFLRCHDEPNRRRLSHPLLRPY
jgi:single-strand DNA-binding protein